MASSAPRKIVHIKDVFPNLNIPTVPRRREISDDEDDEDETTPSAGGDDIKTSSKHTSDIFFGNSNVDVFRKDTSKKRRAPAPPVLIDIDVGYLDQMAPDDGATDYTRPESPDSAGATSGGSGGTGEHTTNSHLGPPPDDRYSAQDALNDAYDDDGGYESPRSLLDDFRPPPPPPPPPPSSGAQSPDFPVPPPRSSRAAMSPGVRTADEAPPVPVTPRVLEEEEEEFFVDFDEEEYEDVTDNDLDNDTGKPRLIYKEYQGEDFSQYLMEDEWLPEAETKPKVKRRIKKRKGAKPPMSPNSSTSISSNENSSAKKSLRNKLAQMFGRSNEPERPTSPVLGSNSIHTFTFADAKIGITLGDKDLDDNMNSRMYEKNPNAQTKSNRRSGNRWWNKETLSAFSTSSNSDVLLKARRNSMTDLVTDGSFPDNISAISDPTMNATHFSGSQENVNFESYRKNLMYNTRGRKNNKWSRFFKRGSDAEYRGNIAVNPLSNGDGSGF